MASSAFVKASYTLVKASQFAVNFCYSLAYVPKNIKLVLRLHSSKTSSVLLSRFTNPELVADILVLCHKTVKIYHHSLR